MSNSSIKFASLNVQPSTTSLEMRQCHHQALLSLQSWGWGNCGHFKLVLPPAFFLHILHMSPALTTIMPTFLPQILPNVTPHNPAYIGPDNLNVSELRKIMTLLLSAPIMLRSALTVFWLCVSSSCYLSHVLHRKAFHSRYYMNFFSCPHVVSTM